MSPLRKICHNFHDLSEFLRVTLNLQATPDLGLVDLCHVTNTPLSRAAPCLRWRWSRWPFPSINPCGEGLTALFGPDNCLNYILLSVLLHVHRRHHRSAFSLLHSPFKNTTFTFQNHIKVTELKMVKSSQQTRLACWIITKWPSFIQLHRFFFA